MIAQIEPKVEILIAEDSPTQAEQLRYLLEERGYGVRVAPNGRKALALAIEEKPALIISDVMMPELDGFGLCNAIKADETLKDTPVILLTALASSDDVIRGLESGADFFLRKPYDERHLLSRIDHVLSNRSLREAARTRGELEVVLAGQLHSIHSGRQQILDLLISTYEEAVRINEELMIANRNLEIRNSEIERASHFKDQFLSTMSHELRTPLNAVLGFSELLTDPRSGPLNDRQKRYLQHVHTGGQHLLRLINDILDLSIIEAGRLHLSIGDVPVHALFAEVGEALQSLVEKKSQLLVQFASPELVVRADAIRLRQILTNLIGNAIKFTPERGKIELAARLQGDLVRIEVRDSGPGIPLLEQERIFDAFHRLRQSDKTVEGTGLGLAIARSLVELQGGSLNLESEPGAGSCFYFTLPVAQAPHKWRDERIDPAGSSLAEVMVLVIEDDPAAADLIESQLVFAGYKVVVCNRSQQAVEAAAELQPSAVTLDIMMRPVSGWDVLSALKSDPRTAKIPVIVISIVDQRPTGVLLGADEYIVKPVNGAILLAAMERCLSRRVIESGQDILVVEDDAASLEFVSDLLSSRGHVVRTAVDGIEARAQVEAALPRLVILDLTLPGVSGIQLIAQWRAHPHTANLPIFVLTSKDLSQEEREFLDVNTEALFSKQEQGLEALMKQIKRAAPLAVASES
jgi:DNA-binding response OmpR family regulator/anti-sigma regulatory factor (Ser/Thr protein kinase)